MIAYLLFISLILGPFAGIALPGIPASFYLSDLAAFVCCIYCLIQRHRAYQFIRCDVITKIFTLLCTVFFLSLVFTPLNLLSSEWTIGALYLLRFIMYFFVYLYCRLQTKEFNLINRIAISIAVLAGVGWLQYWLYPDLRNLYYLGWDPHDRRIFSTYLDPNFFGLMLVLGGVTFYHSTLKKSVTYGGIALIFITLIFTYSRSSYVALVGAVITEVLLTRRYRLLSIIFCLGIGVLLLPRPHGESANLMRVFTIEGRIQNAQSAFAIVEQYPILGVGFNTIRYARKQIGSRADNLEISHSGAGFDNSFLFVVAASGVIGFFVYIAFLFVLYIKTDTLSRVVLTAVIIHSLFVNSLFYPSVLMIVWMTLLPKKPRIYGE